jgi:hypothetical protein
MTMRNYPLPIFNTSTNSGLQNFILAYNKSADDVRVLLKEPGAVDVLILMKPKWWWRFTFGHMRRKHIAEVKALLEWNGPLGIVLTPRIFYDRTEFLRIVVGNE